MLVTKLFPCNDDKELIVHIATFDWDFRNFGPVELKFGDESIKCRYIASGNQKNEAVLRLALDDPRYETAAKVAKKFDAHSGKVLIDRLRL